MIRLDERRGVPRPQRAQFKRVHAEIVTGGKEEVINHGHPLRAGRVREEALDFDPGIDPAPVVEETLNEHAHV